MLRNAELSDIRRALRIACSSRRGVKPGYGYSKVLKFFLLLAEREPLGRHLLSRELGIGEASVRTLVKRLREGGFVEVDRVGGCVLTEAGKRALHQLLSVAPRMRDVNDLLKDLALDRYAYAARLRAELRDVVKARDSLIRCGASAALILVVIENKLVIPPGGYGEDSYPELSYLKKVLGVESGELVIVSFAGSKRRAEEALLEWLARLLLA